MGPFTSLEIKEFSKSFFSNLSPNKAPYYFLIASCAITSIIVNSNLDGIKWYVSYISLFFLSLYFMITANYSTVTKKITNIYGEIQVARIVGIAISLLSLAFYSNDMKYSNVVFYTVFATVSFQVIYYVYNLRIPQTFNSEANLQTINVPQLTLITNILLITTLNLSSNLALRDYVFIKVREKERYSEVLRKYEHIPLTETAVNETRLRLYELYESASYYSEDSNETFNEIILLEASLQKHDSMLANGSLSINYQLFYENKQKYDEIDTSLTIFLNQATPIIDKATLFLDGKKIKNLSYELAKQYPKYLRATILIWFLWFVSFLLLAFKTNHILKDKRNANNA